MTTVFAFITDLGDSALLLPASAFLLGYCLDRGSRTEAAIWASTLVICGAITLLLKIGLQACGTENQLINIHNPSGHASFSTTFYMCSAMMVSADKEERTKFFLLIATGMLALTIAASRIILNKHTVAEVALGLLIGAASVVWFGWWNAGKSAALPWQPLISAVILLALVTHGLHFTLENIADQLRAMLLGSACPL